MSKKLYITTTRIEDRDKDGKKSVIPAHKELELTAAQAKTYGKAVKEVVSADEEETGTDDDTSGEGNGSEGGGA